MVYPAINARPSHLRADTRLQHGGRSNCGVDGGTDASSEPAGVAPTAIFCRVGNCSACGWPIDRVDTRVLGPCPAALSCQKAMAFLSDPDSQKCGGLAIILVRPCPICAFQKSNVRMCQESTSGFSSSKRTLPFPTHSRHRQVGLPARGKSYMVKKLSRYLTWLGYETNVFNVGEARRKTPGFEIADHSFFSSGDADARRMREQIAFSVLDVCGMILSYLCCYMHIADFYRVARALFASLSSIGWGATGLAWACLMQPTRRSIGGAFLTKPIPSDDLYLTFVVLKPLATPPHAVIQSQTSRAMQ